MPEEQLKQLEWMIGDWVDESPEALVVTSYRWTDNQCFILSEFKVQCSGQQEMTGTQRIGWVPLAKTIRSWVFDSEGGFGEGTWTRDGDQWIVKRTGVTRDGKIASSTNVITRVSNDRMTWQSRDRIVGGETTPDMGGNPRHANTTPAQVRTVAFCRLSADRSTHTTGELPMNTKLQNTMLKRVGSIAVIVVLSAGVAMAGRGGGHAGGGHAGSGGHAGASHAGGASHPAASRAGGASRPAATHTPSFSTPRPRANTSRPAVNTRPAEKPAVRPSSPANRPAEKPAVRPSIDNRAKIANRPEVVNRPSVENRPNVVNRPNVGNQTNIANRTNVANRTHVANNININNRTNNLVRPTHADWNRGDWYHGDWHGHWNNNGWYYRPVGWWTAGYWAGAAVSRFRGLGILAVLQPLLRRPVR